MQADVTSNTIQPCIAGPVVSTYRSGQSTVIGILLIIAGALSIIFNIVDIAVGTVNNHYYSYYYQDETLSYVSNGIAGHGLWCGIMVSIIIIFIIIMFFTGFFLNPTAINIICTLDGITFHYQPKQMIGTL